MKTQYFLLVDTETTQDDKVADFGAVVCDKKGNIVAQCGVMVDGIFTNMQDHPLFFTSDPAGIWSKKGQDKRYNVYNDMIKNGSRMIASVAAINRWLARVNEQYNPILTAYNLPFDLGKCRNTGIDLEMFTRNFCLMAVAQNLLLNNKKFLMFCLENHCFNNRTEKTGSMTLQMKAENVAGFLNGNLDIEPHTALEDVLYFEICILAFVCRKQSIKSLVSYEGKAIGYTKRQLRDLFTVK